MLTVENIQRAMTKLRNGWYYSEQGEYRKKVHKYVGIEEQLEKMGFTWNDFQVVLLSSPKWQEQLTQQWEAYHRDGLAKPKYPDIRKNKDIQDYIRLEELLLEAQKNNR